MRLLAVRAARSAKNGSRRKNREAAHGRPPSCACGLVMPRDQASAIMTAVRALLAFREGADPGGRVAERRKKAAEAEASGERLKAARLEGGRKAREKKKQSLQGVWPCASESGAERQEFSPVKGVEVQTDPLPLSKSCFAAMEMQ